jgi:Fic family protein
MHVEEPPPSESLTMVTRKRVFELLDEPTRIPGHSDYLHWDKLRHLDPPTGLDHRHWWIALKLARRPLQRELPLRDAAGKPLTFATPDGVLRLLHQVDQSASGQIAMPEVVTADEQARQHYLVNSLMEESIRSSQLEGATTSRSVAKELLRSGRQPNDRSERMILNNYRALQFMREQMGDRLRPAAVLALHRILTEGTLDNPDAAGRLQQPDEDRVAVHDRANGKVIYRPPPADQLPARLEALCGFANRGAEDQPFIHPVVRAILLHFWLAYDHPFEDGNGRTARALFYWSMRVQGYWLTEYLSISRILRNAPAQYSRAFVLTETDEGDTTHFILYQLQVIKRAIKELHAYLRRKVAEVQGVEQLIRGSAQFNHRQLALLGDAIRKPDRRYTFRSHAASHDVTHETARRDLGELAERGLLERRRSGRQHLFVPPADLADRLQHSA